MVSLPNKLNREKDSRSIVQCLKEVYILIFDHSKITIDIMTEIMDIMVNKLVNILSYQYSLM